MDNSCFTMASPGKCGFFILGMFFMLALASWTFVYKSRVPQEIIDNNEYLLEDSPEAGHSGSTFENVLRRQADHKRLLAERLQARIGFAKAARTERALTDEDTDDQTPHERMPTFLATMEHSFIDVHPTAEGEIPTMAFLEACAGPKKLLTGLGRIMSRVWADVGGNIEMIEGVYNSDPTQFATLEAIVRADIKRGVAGKDGSAAMAVLWLKRAFEFVAAFFDNMRGGQVPTEAAADAYREVLSPFHSFWVRPIFYTGMKMLGTKDEVLRAMALHPGDPKSRDFQYSVFCDMEEYTIGMKKLLVVLDAFMKENNLNI